jgi:hypothetical protein
MGIQIQFFMCGRYWDRYVDMSNSHIYLDEIPTWFQYYTNG